MFQKRSNHIAGSLESRLGNVQTHGTMVFVETMSYDFLGASEGCLYDVGLRLLTAIAD